MFIERDHSFKLKPQSQAKAVFEALQLYATIAPFEQLQYK